MEESILKMFSRARSTYCRPFKKTNRCKTFSSIYERVKRLDFLQRAGGVDYFSRVPSNKKYYSIALRENPSNETDYNQRIEFRGIGNTDYHLREKDLTFAMKYINMVAHKSLNLCV